MYELKHVEKIKKKIHIFKIFLIHTFEHVITNTRNYDVSKWRILVSIFDVYIP